MADKNRIPTDRYVFINMFEVLHLTEEYFTCLMAASIMVSGNLAVLVMNTLANEWQRTFSKQFCFYIPQYIRIHGCYQPIRKPIAKKSCTLLRFFIPKASVLWCTFSKHVLGATLEPKRQALSNNPNRSDQVWTVQNAQCEVTSSEECKFQNACQNQGQE